MWLKRFSFFILFLAIHPTQASADAALDTVLACDPWHQNKSEELCLREALSLAKRKSGDAVALEKLGAYIGRFDQGGSAVVYRSLVETVGPKTGCTKSGVKGAAMQALHANDAEVGNAGEALAKLCVDTMSTELKSALGDRQPQYLKRVCPILREKKMLSGLQSKRCENFKS